MEYKMNGCQYGTRLLCDPISQQALPVFYKNIKTFSPESY